MPAYTNCETIYMSPSVEEWKNFYLSQFEGEELDSTEDIEYTNCATSSNTTLFKFDR